MFWYRLKVMLNGRKKMLLLNQYTASFRGCAVSECSSGMGHAGPASLWMKVIVQSSPTLWHAILRGGKLLILPLRVAFVFRCTVQTSSFGTAFVLTCCNRDIKGDKLELGWFMFSVVKATCQLTSAVRLPWLSSPSLLTAVCLCLCNLSARSASEPQTKHNAKSSWSGTGFSHTHTHAHSGATLFDPC